MLLLLQRRGIKRSEDYSGRNLTSTLPDAHEVEGCLLTPDAPVSSTLGGSIT